MHTIAELQAASPTAVKEMIGRIDVRGTVLRQIRRDAKRVTPTREAYLAALEARVPVPCKTCEGTGKVTPRIRSVGGIHPSGAHKCRTRQYYDIMAEEETVEEVEPDLYFIFEIGSAVHAIIQRALHRALGDKFEDEVPIHFDEVLIDGGSADGRIREVDWSALLECKTMGAQFLKLNSPKKEHVLQATIYARALDLPFLVFLYLHKEDSEIKQFVLPYDERVFRDWVTEKVKPIERALETRVPPPADADKYECSKCPYGAPGKCPQKVGNKDAFQRRF